MRIGAGDVRHPDNAHDHYRPARRMWCDYSMGIRTVTGNLLVHDAGTLRGAPLKNSAIVVPSRENRNTSDRDRLRPPTYVPICPPAAPTPSCRDDPSRTRRRASHNYESPDNRLLSSVYRVAHMGCAGEPGNSATCFPSLSVYDYQP